MPLPSYAAFDEKALGAQVLLSQYKLRTSGDAVTVRQAVARYMKEHGATALSVTRFATAVSEIARNAIVHAGGGEFSIYVDPRAKQLTVVCWDKGSTPCKRGVICSQNGCVGILPCKGEWKMAILSTVID